MTAILPIDPPRLVTVELDGKSVTVPLHHFAPFLTSASLALTEWERKAVAKCAEGITLCAVRDHMEDTLESVRDCAADLRDHSARRASLVSMEALWRP